MHILALTKGDMQTASSRVRVWQLFKKLEPLGFKTNILHSFAYTWWSVSPRRFFALRTLYLALRQKPEIILVHKSLFPWDVIGIVLLWCRVTHTPFIYDCDDAEWIHSSAKTRMLMKNANIVFAGSQVIKKYAEELNPHVELIPSVVDHELYRDIAHDSDPPAIVWVGHGPAHLRSGNFDSLRDALRILSKRGQSFQFVLIGGKNHDALHAFWEKETYTVRIIDEADWANPVSVPDLLREVRPRVGAMPLADTQFVRAKCAYKTIEYMAAGIPVVASPVGEAISLISNAQAGILANTAQEWSDALSKLLGDGALRKSIGDNNLLVVKNEYSYVSVIPIVEALLGRLT